MPRLCSCQVLKSFSFPDIQFADGYYQRLFDGSFLFYPGQGIVCLGVILRSQDHIPFLFRQIQLSGIQNSQFILLQVPGRG